MTRQAMPAGAWRWYGTVEDMHDRRDKQAELLETALAESREHHRWSVELSPQVPWTATPDGAIEQSRHAVVAEVTTAAQTAIEETIRKQGKSVACGQWNAVRSILGIGEHADRTASVTDELDASVAADQRRPWMPGDADVGDFVQHHASDLIGGALMQADIDLGVGGS